MQNITNIIAEILCKRNLLSTIKYDAFLDEIKERNVYIISENTVKNILLFIENYGSSYVYVPSKKTVYKYLRDAEIVKSRDNGMTSKQIGELFNLNRRRVDQILKKKREEAKNKDKRDSSIEIILLINEDE